MKYFKKHRRLNIAMTALTLITIGTAALPGCAGLQLPPIPVTYPIALDVEIPALAGVLGSADVTIEEVCALFDNAELEARVRAEAGNLITDLVEITRVELIATEISATEGNFDVFTTASLDVLDTARNEVLLLGTAANNDGLGTTFTLTLDNPVDVFNDLDAGDCDAPQLHLEGADAFEGGDITFDVRVSLRVYTTVRQ